MKTLSAQRVVGLTSLQRLSLRSFAPLLVTCLVLGGGTAYADVPAVTLSTGEDGTTSYSVSIQILAVMTLLTLLPSAIIMLTSFTRIVIVFAILRQAIGMQQTPSNQILIGIALFLSVFVMAPVFDRVNEVALQPYLEETLAPQEALVEASIPFREFMLEQTREADLDLFMRLAEHEAVDDVADVDFFVLVPAFMTSELKTAFQIGFMLFVPFLVIDMVVASVLMSMGMMMLSPLIISLPFKIMLFVLVDGWVMIMGTLAASFGMNV
ncbi:MAG: flagellar type III secretion system pore protein FliP [Pseudomonadota bacterium]